MCYIDSVFMENYGIVISKRDTMAASFFSRFGNKFGRGKVGERVYLSGFADAPVLAELAAQITARSPEGKNRSTGIKVV